MAYPDGAKKSASVRNVSKWPYNIKMCNKIAETANNKWSEYDLD